MPNSQLVGVGNLDDLALVRRRGDRTVLRLAVLRVERMRLLLFAWRFQRHLELNHLVRWSTAMGVRFDLFISDFDLI